MAERSAFEKGADLVTKGVEEQKNKNYEEAIRLYEHGTEYFLHAIKFEVQSEEARECFRTKCLLYLDEAKKLKDFLERSKSEEPVKTRKRSSDSKLEGATVVENPCVQWSDIVGLERAKDALRSAVLVPLKFPHLFTGKRIPSKGILLYGPPETGKSLLAKALATDVKNSTFFSISCSNWLGKTEEVVKELFEQARECEPSIIFIDEVDLLCSAQSVNESVSAKRIKTEFLVQMQEINKNNANVLVLGATSNPWTLDIAIRRALEVKLYIPLPDEQARLTIIKSNLENIPHTITEENFMELVKLTNCYSFAGLSHLIRIALMETVRKVQLATHFRRIRGPSRQDPNIMVDDLLTPCSPGCPGAIEMTWTDVEGDKLFEPPVVMNDMLKSIATSKPRVNDDDLVAFETFE